MKKVWKLSGSLNSKTLKNLFMDCCKPSPKDRLTFREIIGKYDQKSVLQILKELDLTETLIESIWSSELKCKEQYIDFNTFHAELIKYFRIQKKPEAIHYLKEALRLPFFLKFGQPDPLHMTRDKFGVIGRIFRFTKQKDDGFIERIVELFKSDWFYGCVNREEAQKQLEAFSKKKSDGIHFIVRFSNSNQLCFTYKNANIWENSIIEPDRVFTKEGYAKYVEQYQQRSKFNKHEVVPSLQKTFSPYK